MNTHSTAYERPAWDGNPEVEITGQDIFHDIDDGYVTIFAVYHVEGERFFDFPRGSSFEYHARVDGLRIVHPCGLIEWRDREWLTRDDSRDMTAADALADIAAGIDEGRMGR
jgi:hypothetical protein